MSRTATTHYGKGNFPLVLTFVDGFRARGWVARAPVPVAGAPNQRSDGSVSSRRDHIGKQRSVLCVLARRFMVNRSCVSYK